MSQNYLTCTSCGWYSAEGDVDPDILDLMECPKCGGVIEYGD